ncbi:hypothetical protein AGLY_004019 [Aphis glycines]|uniref:DDE Tnp4 domain-containing protein n=1 Tax=Aphis glycines TaxID=307491 RepID=A0A6G0TXD7_APHGL|nr:hypothetical protein AGLY_004019 [Aphis glycines]
MQNPIEGFSDIQFFNGLGFQNIVLEIILPMIYLENMDLNNKRGLKIDNISKILIALRFYASGNDQRVIGDTLGYSQSLVCTIIKEISELLAKSAKKWIRFPSSHNLPDIKQHFYSVSQFPGVIGAIDCTHISIKSPGGENTELYRNRKGWMSLNVQIVCGPKMQIFDLVCRWPGSVHDSKIYNNSCVKLLIESNALFGHLIGDSGYPQSKFLYTPKLNPITVAENKYIKSHIKIRNIIERVKGVLKSRFRCLGRKLRTKLQISTLIIISCDILHNVALLTYNLDLQIKNEEETARLPRNDNILLAIPDNRLGNIIKAAFIERHFT